MVFLVLLILPFVIPVNKFRPTIEEKASTAIGAQGTNWRSKPFILFTGSLSAKDLSVGDDPAFSQSPFLTAKSFKIGIEMIPLIFSKQLNITSVAIQNPEVTLLLNPAGQWNYSSLGKSSDANAAPQTTSASPSPGTKSTPVAISKLDLKDGRVVVGDTNSQTRSVFDHVNVSVDDFSP